jgi:transposase
MSKMQIGVDLAKSIFEVAVSPAPGRVQERRRLSRTALTAFFAVQPPAEVLLEPCGSAHHWGRELRRLQQDRPGRRQGPAGGRPQRGDLSRAGEIARAAGGSRPPPAPPGLSPNPHRPDQRRSRPPARVRLRHPGGRPACPAAGGCRPRGGHGARAAAPRPPGRAWPRSPWRTNWPASAGGCGAISARSSVASRNNRSTSRPRAGKEAPTSSELLK